METSLAERIEASAQRLFPHLDRDQVLAELLLERAQKNLIKYQAISRQFTEKYQQDFESFRKMVLDTEVSFEIEQDYFDWELAITGATDMQVEIKRLSSLSN